MVPSLMCTLVFVAGVLGTSLIYDGRAPLNYTQANLDGSVDPYLTLVRLLASIILGLNKAYSFSG
jgi:hypothetical protein